MSQSDFGNLSSPLSGTSFFDSKLEPWRDALHTSHSGNSRPSYVAAGMMWIDTTTNPWILKVFDGSDDITIGTINTSTNVFAAPIADAAISSAKIAANAVTTSKILDANVTPAKLDKAYVSSVVTGVTGADVVTNAMSLTAAEYAAIGAPDAATLYIITDA